MAIAAPPLPTEARFARPFSAAGLVAVALAAAPVLTWAARTWLEGTLGGGGAGLLTLPACAMLVGVASKRPADDGPFRVAPWATILVGVALYVLGAASVSAHREGWMLAGLGLPLMAHGLIGGAQGPETARRYVFPLYFSYFALPWELFLRELDQSLQILSAQFAVALLHVGGYAPRFWNDYTFYDDDYYLIINETCSGMNMLVTLGMYTLVFGWATLRSLSGRATLLALVFPLAMTANALRIVAIFLMGKYGGDDLAMGPWHTGSAYLVFLPIFWVLYRVSVRLGRRERALANAAAAP